MIGERLGKWSIYKELGRGGMGRVYLGQEEMDGRLAAIKVLSAELAQETGFLQRFQREIEAISQLAHPNIIRFYEAGHENGVYFYAMEYVEGQNLEELLEDKKRVSWKEVIDVALQLCMALKHAHDHGIVHRDLKPTNILRTPEGAVKLGDFGIAKVFASQHLTATGGIIGTAEFISPEQAAGKSATKKSDMYSLGVVLYTLLIGKPPFEGRTPLDLLHKHRYGQFDRPNKVVPEIPHELDEIVCSLLEKNPDKRPADGLVLAKQFEKFRNKMWHKQRLTDPNAHRDKTIVENSQQRVSKESKEGAATMMSRLVREELERQNRGGPFTRFLNQPVVLVICLLACLGVIVWTFWPLTQEQLFQRGSDMMEKGTYSDWQYAWTEYFEPLNERFPDHPYREEVQRYRRQIDAERARRDNPVSNGAKRFYQKGEHLREVGDLEGARQTWQSLVDVFESVESEQEWVDRARDGLLAVERAQNDEALRKPVRKALANAGEFHEKGETRKAIRIWRGVVNLYANEPQFGVIVGEAKEKLAEAGVK
ncbi:MAG: serine/threonine protein kinase [Gemmataceae bacterium]